MAGSRHRRQLGLGLALAAAVMACGGPRTGGQGGSKDDEGGAAKPAHTAECPAFADAPSPLPGVSAEHQTLDYWIDRLGTDQDLDEVLLAPGDIADLNRALELPRPKYSPRRDLSVFDVDKLRREVGDRLAFVAKKGAAGEYVTADGKAPPAAASQEATVDGSEAELRVALDTIQFRCFPSAEPLYIDAADPRFDKNACSAARPQQLVRVIGPWPGGMQLAETSFAFGWIAGDAPLSPPVPDKLRSAYVDGPRLRVPPGVVEASGASTDLAEVTLLPAAGERSVHFATADGFHQSAALRDVRPAAGPLTRRAVLTEAFSFLGDTYGFGDAGGRDCSRILLDLFARLGIHLPRHSSWQARAGTFSIDVSSADEDNKRKLIDAAAERGLVLLSFTGHIMLYLGRTEDGTQMAFHSLGEYMETCQTKAGDQVETIRTVSPVGVSTLELGRGTSRTAFIERIDRITVLGKPPGPALLGVAEMRPAAPVHVTRQGCGSSGGAELFVSPDKPNGKQPLRVIATASDFPGPVELTLIDPRGQAHRPELIQAGGPPFGYIATIEAPAPGKWRAVLGDGNRVLACERIHVRHRPDKPRLVQAGSDPVWPVSRSWNRATENLYAVFIERLFDYPLEKDDQTWPSLQPLLRNPDNNILYGHLNPGEEDQLELLADCADLPFTLRAYFAWKMRLPFAYRSCRRGRGDRPPTCRGSGGDNGMAMDDFASSNEIKAFEHFANRKVRRTIHSSGPRTRPNDDKTDLYPVPLTREALVPGTVFADPYGHILVVAKWIPQTLDGYGVLLAADAQPDGTIGRRRFWRGSFLFHPDFKAGGAGFKAYRPQSIVRENGSEELRALENRELAKSRQFAQFSMQQYKGTTEDFYRELEALINPRPLDPFDRQKSLVDAFEEQVARRVNSVQNGETFMAERDFRPIEMPHGSSIFLTEGPWEDYSSPSRDMRLLIALDTVTQFPDRVKASPERFGFSKDKVEAGVTELREVLQKELEARSVTYVRSDGQPATITLAQIVKRQKLLEMAYNPNDCVEIRWLAKGDELATCKRRAPAEQKKRMAEYRSWFETRRRPAD